MVFMHETKMKKYPSDLTIQFLLRIEDVTKEVLDSLEVIIWFGKGQETIRYTVSDQ